MTRDDYFRIFKGDDTDFNGNQELLVVLETELDLTGCTAHFKFLGFKQDFYTIPADKKLHIVIPHQYTRDFPCGSMDAQLWLLDANSKKRTVANRIHMIVTQSIDEAYNSDDEQAITVQIASGVQWENVSNKPAWISNWPNALTEWWTTLDITDKLTAWWNSIKSTVSFAWSQITDKPNDLVVNAALSSDEKTLTLTKQNGSTVEFQGGGSGGQVQSNWTQTNTQAVDFIKNKPRVGNSYSINFTDDISNLNYINGFAIINVFSAKILFAENQSIFYKDGAHFSSVYIDEPGWYLATNITEGPIVLTQLAIY